MSKKGLDKRLALAGLQHKLDEYYKRLEYEIGVIEEMGYGLFLIVRFHSMG